jgi:hypothetical protein
VIIASLPRLSITKTDISSRIISCVWGVRAWLAHPLLRTDLARFDTASGNFFWITVTMSCSCARRGFGIVA